MNSNNILDSDIIGKDGENNGQPIQLINTNRFILLSVMSFGLYNVWWMYKSWIFFKEKDNLDIVPAGRAIFAIFFLYGLFDIIQLYAKQNGINKDFSSGLMYVGFLFFNFSSKLPEPFDIMVSIFAFLPIIPGLNLLNEAIEASPDYKAEFNPRFNQRQIVLIVIGALFWLLVIAGLMLPEEY